MWIEWPIDTSLFVCPLRHASISDWVKRLYNPVIKMSQVCQEWRVRCQLCYNRAMMRKTEDGWQVAMMELVSLTYKILLWYERLASHRCLGLRPWGGRLMLLMYVWRRLGWRPGLGWWLWVPSSWCLVECLPRVEHQHISTPCDLWHSANVININVTTTAMASNRSVRGW